MIGLVHFVYQQHAAVILLQGSQQRARLQKRRREENIIKPGQAPDGLAQALGALQDIVELFLQHLGVEQLFAVFPFVQGLGLVQTFVALQANQGQGEHRGAGLGKLGLANPGRAFDEHGFLQVAGQIDSCGDGIAADVAVLLQTGFQTGDGSGWIGDLAYSA